MKKEKENFLFSSDLMAAVPCWDTASRVQVLAVGQAEQRFNGHSKWPSPKHPLSMLLLLSQKIASGKISSFKNATGVQQKDPGIVHLLYLLKLVYFEEIFF